MENLEKTEEGRAEKERETDIWTGKDFRNRNIEKLKTAVWKTWKSKVKKGNENKENSGTETKKQLPFITSSKVNSIFQNVSFQC